MMRSQRGCPSQCGRVCVRAMHASTTRRAWASDVRRCLLPATTSNRKSRRGRAVAVASRHGGRERAPCTAKGAGGAIHTCVRSTQLYVLCGGGQQSTYSGACTSARCCRLRCECVSGAQHARPAHGCGFIVLLRPWWAPIRAQSGGDARVHANVASQPTRAQPLLPAPRALRLLASHRAASGSAQLRRLRGSGGAGVQRALAVHACAAKRRARTTHARRASTPQRCSRTRCSGSVAAATCQRIGGSRTDVISARATTRAAARANPRRLAPCSSRTRTTRPRWWSSCVRAAAPWTCKWSAARRCAA